tara:strand:- start:49 stop:699 length:651 start_codon:yes stop_codon:yes gene_type:complete
MKIGGIEYTNLTDDFGYWTVYVEDINDYLPIKIKNNPDNYNPFTGWDITDEVKDFVESVIRKIYMLESYKLNVNTWGNYFNRSRYTYHKFHHIPHIDGPGWVGNLWLSDNEEGSRGTQFYNYKDEWKTDEFTCPRPFELLKELETTWKQWDTSDVEKYGFEYMGTAPAKKNTITLYNSCVPHKAYIGEKCNTSWSQLVQVSKKINLNSNVSTLKDE